jgi:hypothetical protein
MSSRAVAVPSDRQSSAPAGLRDDRFEPIVLGGLEPFGDFDLVFEAAKYNLKIIRPSQTAS